MSFTDYMTAAKGVIKASLCNKDHQLAPSTHMILNDCINQGFDGDNAVCGIWFADEFFESDRPEPFFLVGVGEDGAKKYEGPESLFENIMNKARACALTGVDTLTATANTHHFTVVRGRYFPFGGAVIRSVGRVQLVVAISGFTQEEDHIGCVRVWSEGVEPVLSTSVAEDLRLANLRNDPARVRYPFGIVPQPAGFMATEPGPADLYRGITDGDYNPTRS